MSATEGPVQPYNLAENGSALPIYALKWATSLVLLDQVTFSFRSSLVFLLYFWLSCTHFVMLNKIAYINIADFE